MTRILHLIAGALFCAAAVPAAADTPATPLPAAMPGGALIGPALHVSNVERSLKFYVDGLGLKVGIQMGPPQRRETILTFGGDPTSAGIILLDDTAATTPPVIGQSNGFDRVVLRVADLTATAARLHAAGFAPSDIRDVTMGYRMMTVTDPDGYKYELVQTGPTR